MTVLVAGAAEHRPNVVFIISDEHQVNALGCYGSVNRTRDGESPTPNLDRLAADGTRYTNAYTASPLCAPSRASLMTGVYPYVHTATRHLFNGGPPGHHRFPGILPDLTTIGEAFREAGYTTAAIGKVHVHGELRGVDDLGFDHSELRFYTDYPGAQYADFGQGDWIRRYREMPPYATERYRQIDPERFAAAPPTLTPKTNGANHEFMETLVEREDQAFDHLVAEHSNRYIARCVREHRPFFIYVGFEKPHEPYSTFKRYMDLFPPSHMVLPQSWNDAAIKGPLPFVPAWLTIAKPQEDLARNTMAAYYACVRELDEQVGKVIQQCRNLGIADNTIFVYTTDHGDSMYTHSMIEKHCMFEMADRVPLIISYPKRFARGAADGRLASLLDVPPTLLQLAGVPVPKTFEGVSLLTPPVDPATSSRLVFSEFYEAGPKTYRMFPGARCLPMRMCRYKNYKYVYTHGFIEQLYDLARDPGEEDNLVLTAGEKFRPLIEQLRLATLDGWSVDECPLFQASVERKDGVLDFQCPARPETSEYILYRSPDGNPLRAEVVARGPRPALVDRTPLAGPAYYWLVAVPQLERMDPENVTYRGVPVATKHLAPGLPASMRMRVVATDQKKQFPYVKRRRY